MSELKKDVLAGIAGLAILIGGCMFVSEIIVQLFRALWWG